MVHSHRLYVPPAMRAGLLFKAHDEPYSGHLGVDKTAEKLQRAFWWPRLWDSVRNHVAACHACQLARPCLDSHYGLLKPLEIPERPFSHLSLDLMTGLPLSPEGRCHACGGGQLDQIGACSPLQEKGVGCRDL